MFGRNPSPLNEFDQLLVPAEDNAYRSYTLMQLARRLWRGVSSFGMASLHYITQRGPYQDGESILDIRFDPRIIQLLIADWQWCRTDTWNKRNDILDYIRPNRSFGEDGVVRPLVYRKWLPSGKIEAGCDLVTTNGSNTVRSAMGRFVGNGLEAGHAFTITTGADAGTYVINQVPNDYTLVLSANMAADATNVCWQYRRGWGKRDLYCLVEEGPVFNEGPDGLSFAPTGFKETIRLIAHDPFWYGLQQTETWALDTNLGDLVFDGEGAWFGASPGAGRWLFAPTFIGESVAVVYWGTRFAKPTIEIDGPATSPLVQNSTTGDTLSLDYTVAVGETVTINTLAQTVTNNASTNLLSFLSGNLATFKLAAAPQAPYRQNEIYVSFSDATADSAARMSWKNRYVGI